MSRRKYPRLIGPFRASWQRAGGQPQVCRIGDISPGGCFVHSTAPPARNEVVTIAIDLDGDPAPLLRGTTIHEEWSDGFGVRFVGMTSAERQAFNQLLGRLRGIRKSA